MTTTTRNAMKRAARRQDRREARQDQFQANAAYVAPATVAQDVELVEVPLVEVVPVALPVEFLLARVGL